MSTTLRCLFVFTIIIQGLLQSTSAEGIPEVRVFYLETLDPSGFKIQWDPIEYKNYSDPIIGVKIKVWKTPCKIKTTNHHYLNGTIMKIVKSERLRFNRTTLPQELPEKVFIVKPDTVSLTVPHIDPEVWYHVRVLAFKENEEGPHSNPTQFKINTDDENDKKKSCERIISQTPVDPEY